jgi:hypothetical protein
MYLLSSQKLRCFQLPNHGQSIGWGKQKSQRSFKSIRIFRATRFNHARGESGSVFRFQ